MTQSTKNLCFGEILWDIFHDESQQSKVLGGAPSNLCYFLNMLGEPATLISQVGHDALGESAIETLKKYHIPHIITTSDLPTGQVDIHIQNHEPHYQFNDPAAWDFIPYSDNLKQIQPSISMIAFGSLAQRSLDDLSSFTTLKALLKDHPQATRFLDLNLRAPHYQNHRILELLTFADILKINQDEFQYLKTLFSLEALSTRDALYQLILQLKLNFIILTLGSEGSIIMSETDYSAQSIQKVEIVNTVGAGDSFSAAFLTALNRGASFSVAHQFANQFSSYICTQKGAFVPIQESFNQTLATFSAW